MEERRWLTRRPGSTAFHREENHTDKHFGNHFTHYPRIEGYDLITR
jgi:hypothetical protein